MTEWYFNPVGGYQLTSALVFALLLLLTLLGLPRHKLTRRQRGVLVCLRLLVIALAMFAMLRPALVQTTSKRQSATLAILVDQSRSMSVADAVGGQTRWDVLRSTLDDALPQLKALGQELEIKLYAFDDQTHELDFTGGKLDLAAVPQGKQTAIGAALEEVLRRESGKRLAGVLLLSDGAQRALAPRDIAPQLPARRLADLGYPLYTLRFGEARGLGQARDVSVRDLSVNETVFVKNDLTVHGVVRSEGYGGRGLPIELLLENAAGKMEPVAGKELPAGKGGENIEITLDTVPQTPGEFKVTLRAARLPGELVTTNNEMSTFVTVLKGGIRVLYLEGSLRVDSKYLLQSLDASPDIKVDYVRLDRRDPAQRPVDLEDRFRRGKYDVYMLGDVDASSFTKDELSALAAVVRQGAGLVMLGGFHTFGPGGYAETPLADLLPVLLDARERQRPGDAIRSDVHLAGPINMRPTKPQGARHYLMRIADGSTAEEVWAKLPPLEGANKLGSAKPAAQILGESGDAQPLLVAHEAGGRVMAFAGDTTWHWWMEGFEAQHKRFWRQIVLWLARKDEMSDGNAWVKLAQRRYGPQQHVEFAAGARSPQGEPLTDVQFTAEVLLPGGKKQAVHLVQRGDQVSGAFDDTQATGDYAVVVTAQQGGRAVGTARARFLVFEQDLELDNAAADPTLLSSLSAVTKEVGGQSLAPEELPDLLRRMQEQPPEMEVETQVKHTPWDTWPFLLLFVGVISLEWYLRKKWGLV